MTISFYLEPMTVQVGLISLGLVLALSGLFKMLAKRAGKEGE